MKNTVRLMFAAVALFICMTGCGKDKKENTRDTEEASTEATVEIATIQEPVVATPIDAEKKDKDGFVIRNDYVKAVEDYVNVRTEPSADAPIFRIVQKGTVMERTGDKADWTRINMEETAFYVYSEYVEVTEEPVNDTSSVPSASGTDANESGKPTQKKVVIDAANQATPNFELEEIGPKSKNKKQCATSGKTGIALGVKEYEINLIYARSLEEELKNRGYEVVLTRSTDNADISNKQRAELANASGASALIRIQMNYSSDTKISGVMAICMSEKSPYNSSLFKYSNELSTRLIQGILSKVDVTNRGILETDEITLVNWSNIPVAVIKPGFLSNVSDEANLSSDEYRKKIISGIADGLDLYFEN